MNILEANLNLGQLAKKYARDQIVHGCSQIENNDLPAEYFAALDTAVLSQLRELLNQPRSDPFKLMSDDLYHYEKTIIITSKYSLGNCHEMACQAMDYLLTVNADESIRAEIFTIEGERGDHMFLVIGRDVKSDENDPSKWGDSVVICDPWSDAVYPAYEYKTKLKTFYREYHPDGTITNKLLDYDPLKHRLIVLLSLDDMLAQRKNSNLLYNYHNQLRLIEEQLIKYQKKLKTRSAKLKSKYGDEDIKWQIVNKKLTEVDDLLSLFKMLDNNNHSNIDYREFHRYLRKNLNTIFEKINKILFFSNDEIAAISQYRDLSSIKGKTRMFCNIPTHTEKVIKKANEQLISKLASKK